VEDIKAKIINELSLSASTCTSTSPGICIGLLQHNYKTPFYSLVQPEALAPGSIVYNVLSQDRDWFLESHNGVNLKTVYFTEAIEGYRGTLAVDVNIQNALNKITISGDGLYNILSSIFALNP